MDLPGACIEALRLRALISAANFNVILGLGSTAFLLRRSSIPFRMCLPPAVFHLPHAIAGITFRADLTLRLTPLNLVHSPESLTDN